MKKIIATNKAPKAIGPYSQGVCFENMVFTSGQLPIHPETGIIQEQIQKQTKQAIENVEAILKEKGLTLENVIKTTVFLKDMNDFLEMNKVYETYFTKDYPARSAVEVARLPKDALVEIEVIAVQK
ncbi:RidA family protein [Wukongibacter sp. M2B1]|uniref:RidA family protein n=1 Tax=Wukongibacter sp. M2B1 TaxID=3088895 RepID=UPI003D7B5443